jgi:hypothetical protein
MLRMKRITRIVPSGVKVILAGRDFLGTARSGWIRIGTLISKFK